MMPNIIRYIQDPVSLGFVVVSLSGILWYYWKLMKAYKKFPTYPMFTYMIYAYICKKIPSDAPITSFFFQKLFAVSKNFEKNGLFLIWFLRPQLLIFGEEAVKVFSNSEECLDKTVKYKIMEDIVGLGLGTCNGERWIKHRKIFNPLFHVGMLKEKMTIFNENAENLVKRLKEVKNKPCTNILDYLKFSSFCVLCESIIGIKVNKEENKVLIENFLETMTKLLEYSTTRITYPWLRFKSILFLTSTGRKYLKMYNENQKFTRKMVLDIKKSVLSNIPTDAESDDNKPHRKSFTHILIEHHLENKTFSLQDIQDEITTFISAGFYSVANTSMWCIYMLGLHQDLQENCYNEVASVAERFVSFDDLYKLQYLECFIKETLRLYPTVPLYGRTLKKEVQCGNYIVPKGTDIVFFPYKIHRNPKAYPDPEKFDPDRFLEGNTEKSPYVHVPFAEGIRSCIGKKFALMEIKVTLAHILRSYKIISLDKREAVELCWDVNLRAVKPLNMLFIPRQILPTACG